MSTAPVHVSQLAEDREGLQRAFTEFGATHNYNFLRTFAVHHDLKQLLALGFVKAAPGRWSAGRYSAGPNLFPDDDGAAHASIDNATAA